MPGEPCRGPAPVKADEPEEEFDTHRRPWFPGELPVRRRGRALKEGEIARLSRVNGAVGPPPSNAIRR